MGIEATVAHPDPHFIEMFSNSPTSGHTYNINPRSAAAVAALPVGMARWRRFRFTYEWAGLTPLWIAGSHWNGVAVNIDKHDGTGTYYHHQVNAGANVDIAGRGRSIGVMEGFGHMQDGQTSDGGWWQVFFTGYLTVDNSPNPNSMGGDYWSVQGRAAVGGGDFALGSFSGETGRTSLHVVYDWPVA